MNTVHSASATKPLNMFLSHHQDCEPHSFSITNQCFILILLILFSFSIFAGNMPSVVIDPAPKTVALIFEDGPSATFTPQILSILKKYNIKATFFMVGNRAKALPEIVKMVVADGHNIANHTLTHVDLTKVSDAQLRSELNKTQMIIHHLSKSIPVCFHYPYRLSNDHTDSILKENNLINIPTGLDSYDYYRPGVNVIINSVLQNVSAGQVITFHDGFDMRQETVNALPQVIEGIKKKGLGFSQICTTTHNKSQTSSD